MGASVSKAPLTSFFPISFSAAIFSISCDFVIWAAIFVSFSLIRCHGQYLEKPQEPTSARICTAFVQPLARAHETHLPMLTQQPRRRSALDTSNPQVFGSSGLAIVS